MEGCAGAFRLTSGKTRLVVDSSGIKQHNTGAWMERGWKVRRGFVKAHILADVDAKKIPALKITDWTVGDSTAFQELLDGAPKIIGHAPKASAAEEIEKKESVGMIRTFAKGAVKDAIPEGRGQGSQPRRVEKMVAYGLRWIVEMVFSALKRVFGESVRR